MVVWRASGMRKLADLWRVLVVEIGFIGWPFCSVCEWSQRDRAGRHKRQLIPLGARVVIPPVAPGFVARVVHGGGSKRGITGRRRWRQLNVRAETTVVLVVVFLDDD